VPTNTPAYILHAMQDLVDASPRGRKGLAEDLGVSREVISYRLNGLQNWPLADHAKVARYLGWPAGGKWLGQVCGDAYGVYRRKPGEVGTADVLGLEASQVAAEGELLKVLNEALADDVLTRLEGRNVGTVIDVLEDRLEDLRAMVAAKAGGK